MDKLEFPVATCPYCKVRGPVYITNSDILEENDPLLSAQIVVCPECVKIINMNGDLEIEYFDAEDAKYFGYKVITDGE